MLKKGIISYKDFLIISFIIIENVLVRCEENCWTSFDAKNHFEEMDNLDDRYEKVRKSYQARVGGKGFDKTMLTTMLKNLGIAERDLHAAQKDQTQIPAGINLGGYCMMKMPNSVLFFHRMKLRNSTVFRITNMQSDFKNLVLIARILLNDLHLFGSYDYTSTLTPEFLYYEPNFGQVEFLLSNVKYNMEGRYRFLKNRLNIELIISELDIEDIVMMYRNQNSTLTEKLDRKNIDVFLERLKIDLDKWLKDYLNDYLMYFPVAEDEQFQKYNQEKTSLLNYFTDNAIDIVIKRIVEIKANAVQLPSFKLLDNEGKKIILKDGVLRGLDSMYRRSVATGIKNKNNVRNVDTVIGFSNLKVIYRYDAILKTSLPPVTGALILTADELTAHMGLSLIKEPETSDLTFRFLEQAKPESLTVEGPANRMISNFKYLLERHIIAIMTNTLMHNINMLGTLDRCVPLLAAFKEPNEADPEPFLDDNSKDNPAILSENVEKNPNESQDKILIGANAPENESISNFNYYHRRVPLPMKRSPRKQRKRYNKLIKRKLLK